MSSTEILTVAPAPEDAFEPSDMTPAAELGTHLRIWARSGLFDKAGLAKVAAEFTDVPKVLQERIRGAIDDVVDRFESFIASVVRIRHVVIIRFWIPLSKQDHSVFSATTTIQAQDVLVI